MALKKTPVDAQSTLTDQNSSFISKNTTVNDQNDPVLPKNFKIREKIDENTTKSHEESPNHPTSNQGNDAGVLPKPDKKAEIAKESAKVDLIPRPTAHQSTAPQPTPEDDYGIPASFIQRNYESEHALMRHKVNEVATLIELGEVDSKSLAHLASVVDNHREIDFDEEYSARDELQTMLKMVRAVRNSIMANEDTLSHDTTVMEVKSILEASMRLTQLLTKSNKELINMERLQTVEACFLEVIGEFPIETQKEYVELFEKRMKLQKQLTYEAEYSK